MSAQEEISKVMTHTCTYAGGIARETQNIRQVENDTWIAFEYKTRLIYKDDEGLTNLLVIAKTVYDFAPIEADSRDVFISVFDSCMGRNSTQTVNLPEFSL